MKRKTPIVTSKSQVSFADAMFEALICDISAARSSSLRKCLKRSLAVARKRAAAEGLSFYTSTMPLLGKAIYRSFETGMFECPTAFSTGARTALPRFLGGLLRNVYDESGTLRKPVQVPDCCELVQLCFFAYKLDVPPVTSHWKSIEKWHKVEDELVNLSIPENETTKLARRLISRALSRFNPSMIRPRQGPGAVATGEVTLEKWVYRRWFPDLSQRFGQIMVTCGNVLSDAEHSYSDPKGPEYELYDRRGKTLGRNQHIMVREYAKTSRMRFVPKDSRGYRLISMELPELMHVQKGLQEDLYKVLQNPKSYLTYRRINFTDQSLNRGLALVGSYANESVALKDNGWCTLDLQDASDRVSVQLVESLFADAVYQGRHYDFPSTLSYLLAARSTHTWVPHPVKGHSLREVRKFAPMGSAICFPVMSLCLWAISVAAAVTQGGMKLREVLGEVYVYGDDLIVSPRIQKYVVDALPEYGLRLNLDKCFIHGVFRESCGMDALSGIPIAPIRWRKPWPSANCQKAVDQHMQEHPTFFQSECEYASLLYSRCYYHAAALVYDKLEVLLGQQLPVVPWNSNVGYLARKSRFPLYWVPPNVSKRGVVDPTTSPIHTPELLTKMPVPRFCEGPQVPPNARLLKNSIAGGDTVVKIVGSKTPTMGVSGSKVLRKVRPFSIERCWSPLYGTPSDSEAEESEW